MPVPFLGVQRAGTHSPVSAVQLSSLLGQRLRLRCRFPYGATVRVGVHPGGYRSTLGVRPWRDLSLPVEPQGDDCAVVNRLQSLIQQRLDERGWTLLEVSRRGGLPKQTLYRLMQQPIKRVPNEATISKLSRGLELPRPLVADAAAESAGIRIYTEVAQDSDTQVVIATMERLSPERRRAIRKMAEALADEHLSGGGR